MNGPDLPRLLGNLIRIGTVESVDAEAGTARLRIGEIVTGDLPWLEMRAGKTRTWSAPSVGEQRILFCPESDIDAGVIAGTLSSDANPAPSSNPAEDLIQFEDGAVIAYDASTHTLRAVLPAGGSAEIEAPDGVSIKGPVSIEGDVTIEGTLTASEDVKADSISLKDHKHGQVQAGGAQSGKPI